MKKILLLAALIFFSLSIFSQEIQEEAVVVNIEVPVRVYKGGKFMDNLTIKDFEVFEDGVAQKVEAVYLVKKRSIERREENRRFRPVTSRNFFLFFEISEYTTKIGDAVRYFVHNKIVPGDNLIIVSPTSTYKLTARALEVKSKEELSKQLIDILIRDATVGYSEYRSAIRDLTSIAQSLTVDGSVNDGAIFEHFDFSVDQDKDLPLDKKIMRYSAILNRVESLRKVDQQKLLDFAKYLRNIVGQKYVFLFYQREFLPQIEPRILDQYMAVYQNQPHITQTLSTLFNLYKRNILFDVNKIKQAYADSSISIHFLFITKPRKVVPGLVFSEQSEDIYSAFKEVSNATGGYSDSSANAAALFRNSLEASENYYLLYYLPKNYKGDGEFKKIEIKVGDSKCKVSHRYGYFAN